jgi:hypothetical protein
MTRRQPARSLTPFDFRADFAPPAEPDPARVTLSPQELTALLDEARAQGMALADAARSDAIAKETAALQARLTAAMADLAAIARHLEVVARGPQGAALASTLLPACQRILDQQADLFAPAQAETDAP